MTTEHLTEPQWYCVSCRTKAEHLAAKHLRLLPNVEVFSPRIRYKKSTKRGIVWWLEALFPGYILAKFSMAESHRAVTYAHGVIKIVRFGDNVPHVPSEFVEVLKEDLEKKQAEEDVLTLAPPIEEGQEVEVATGAFEGVQGIVHEISPATERVKVLLEILGGEQIIEMDIYSILTSGMRPTPPKDSE